jgi:drug/metabolite transporter (DMT)-like permease
MSCSVILFNKYLYTGTFAHPLTLTSVHMGFASVATAGLRAAGRLPVPALGWAFYARNVVPIGVLFALSLGTSNLAAQLLSVSFIQMVKALTPMLTLAIAVSMGMERTSPALWAIVTMMTVGVGIASWGEIEFDAWGLALQLASITAEGARLVVAQALLQAHLPKSNPLVSISLFAPCSFAFLLPVALWKEPGAFAKLLDPAVGGAVALNTLTAFTLNIAVVILVTQTSGLTLTLAGIIKDILLIATSIFLFGSPITYSQIGGYTLALYGLNCYHLYRACKGVGPGGGPVEVLALAKDAASDRNMAAMAGGMVLLAFMAVPG